MSEQPSHEVFHLVRKDRAEEEVWESSTVKSLLEFADVNLCKIRP